MANHINKTSGVPYIYLSKRTGKWCPFIFLDGTMYSLRYYRTIEEAVAIRNEGQRHVEAGDFLTWVAENFPRRPVKDETLQGISQTEARTWIVYLRFEGHSYFLNRHATIEEARAARDEGKQHIADGDFLTWVAEYKLSRKIGPKDAMTNITRIANGTWRVLLPFNAQSYLCGFYTTLEEAMAIRNEGHQHRADGDFLTWYTAKIPQSTKDVDSQGISKTAEGTWRLNLQFKGHSYYLNRHATIEEARAVRDEGQQHITDGDFLTWLAEYKKSRKIGPKDAMTNIARMANGKWKVSLFFNAQPYCCGYYATLEEAMAIRNESHQHRADGDFLTWFAELKKKPSLCIKKTRDGQWAPSVLYEGHWYRIEKYTDFKDALVVQEAARRHIQTGDFIPWLAFFSEQFKSARRTAN